MNEHVGWIEEDADFIARHFRRLIHDIVAERDKRIGELEREADLLRKRIEELSPSILYDQEGIE